MPVEVLNRRTPTSVQGHGEKITEALTGARVFGLVSLSFAIHSRLRKDRSQFSKLSICGVFTSGYAARNLAIRPPNSGYHLNVGDDRLLEPLPNRDEPACLPNSYNRSAR